MAKKRGSKPAKADLVNQAVVLLVNGKSPDGVADSLQPSATSAEAKKIVQLARERIAQAADTNRVEESGRAKMRLVDLYQQSEKVGMPQVALQAVKERNKLLDLYPRDADADDPGHQGELAGALAGIADHLKPLGLLPEDMPLVEHARVAAELINRNRADAGGD